MVEREARTSRSIGFIERNLKKRVTVEDIARDADYSPWHFQRLFRDETGFNVKDYCRKRKLAAAARELAERDRNVLDVALDYGFAHEQSFIRAFEREFGVSPGAFKRRGIPIGITPRILPRPHTARAIGQRTTRGPVSHYYRPARTIVGPRVYFRFREAEENSCTVRVKRDFLRRTEGLWSPGEELYSYVLLVPGDSQGAWFALGYDAASWKGPFTGFDATAIPGHFAASLDVTGAPPLSRLGVLDVSAQYARLNGYGPGPGFRAIDSFNYTVLVPEAISRTASRFSVNLPVEEAGE